MPGHSHRVAPAFDRNRGRELLTDADRSGGGRSEIVLACLDLWRGAAADVAAQFAEVGMRTRVLSADSDPELLAAIEEQADCFIWAWGADFLDPWGGVFDPLLRDFPLYRDDELHELLARAVSIRDQGERLRASREFERRWIGEQAAVVPLAYSDRTLWRRPWLTGMWLNGLVMARFSEAVVDRS
jgi:ABC-type transport system substrate-binding protein